jgi:hypothetical protein
VKIGLLASDRIAYRMLGIVKPGRPVQVPLNDERRDGGVMCEPNGVRPRHTLLLRIPGPDTWS